MEYFKSLMGSGEGEQDDDGGSIEEQGSFLRDWENFEEDSSGSWSSWNPLGGSGPSTPAQPALTPTERRNWRLCFGCSVLRLRHRALRGVAAGQGALGW